MMMAPATAQLHNLAATLTAVSPSSDPACLLLGACDLSNVTTAPDWVAWFDQCLLCGYTTAIWPTLTDVLDRFYGPLAGMALLLAVIGFASYSIWFWSLRIIEHAASKEALAPPMEYWTSAVIMAFSTLLVGGTVASKAAFDYIISFVFYSIPAAVFSNAIQIIRYADSGAWPGLTATCNAALSAPNSYAAMPLDIACLTHSLETSVGWIVLTLAEELENFAILTLSFWGALILFFMVARVLVTAPTIAIKRLIMTAATILASPFLLVLTAFPISRKAGSDLMRDVIGFAGGFLGLALFVVLLPVAANALMQQAGVTTSAGQSAPAAFLDYVRANKIDFSPLSKIFWLILFFGQATSTFLSALDEWATRKSSVFGR